MRFLKTRRQQKEFDLIDKEYRDVLEDGTEEELCIVIARMWADHFPLTMESMKIRSIPEIRRFQNVLLQLSGREKPHGSMLEFPLKSNFEIHEEIMRVIRFVANPFTSGFDPFDTLWQAISIDIIALEMTRFNPVQLRHALIILRKYALIHGHGTALKYIDNMLFETNMLADNAPKVKISS